MPYITPCYNDSRFFLPWNLSAFSLEMFDATYTLGAGLLLREISKYLGIFPKGHKLCMNWRLDLMQTNLLLFGCFRKIFITHSFYKWPSYKLYNRLKSSTRLVWFRKPQKRVNEGKKQCWAFFLSSRATFTKTAIKPNSSIDFLYELQFKLS